MLSVLGQDVKVIFRDQTLGVFSVYFGHVASSFHYFPFFLSIFFFSCPKVLHGSGEPLLIFH